MKRVKLFVSVFVCAVLLLGMAFFAENRCGYAAAAEKITTADVGEITKPTSDVKASEYFDKTETRDDGFNVDNKSCFWSDEAGNAITGDDGFKAGKTYYYTLVLKAKDGYEFADSCSLTIYGDPNNVSSKMTYSVSDDHKTATFANAYQETAGGEQTKIIITSIVLDKDSFVYNGKKQKPNAKKIKVYDQENNPIDSQFYTVKYSKKSSKNPGVYTVTVESSDYSVDGSVTERYVILPKGTVISSITPNAKGFTVKIKKQAKQTDGYTIEYSADEDFGDSKTASTKSSKKTKIKVTGLKSGSTYYVRVNTYKKLKDGGKVNSQPSEEVSITVK